MSLGSLATLYEKHLKRFVGTDKYMSGSSQGESVERGVVSSPSVAAGSPQVGTEWVGADEGARENSYVASDQGPRPAGTETGETTRPVGYSRSTG
jgi:hypothetical protein